MPRPRGLSIFIYIKNHIDVIDHFPRLRNALRALISVNYVDEPNRLELIVLEKLCLSDKLVSLDFLQMRKLRENENGHQIRLTTRIGDKIPQVDNAVRHYHHFKSAILNQLFLFFGHCTTINYLPLFSIIQWIRNSYIEFTNFRTSIIKLSAFESVNNFFLLLPYEIVTTEYEQSICQDIMKIH